MTSAVAADATTDPTKPVPVTAPVKKGTPPPASTGATTGAVTGDNSVPAADAAANGSEEIVVTGSRIRRDVYNSASPIQVITREETTLAGFNNPADVLQGTAVTGGTQQINNSYGGFVVDGGGGVNTLSLRGLGAGRTLVLINGRRVSPAGTRGSVGSADLNVLPSAMIDHIEILRDGASSVYGSDAVAGVVNVITKTKVDGVIFEGQYNKTDEGHGDQARASITGGMSGDRWQFSASGEYFDREDLALKDRDYAKCNTDYRLNRSTGTLGDYIDPLTGLPKCYPITGTGSQGVTINTIGTSTAAGVGAPGSVGTTFNRFRPNSAVTTGVVGYEGVGGGLNNLNVRDTFEPRELNRTIINGEKVYTAFLQGSYDLKALGDAQVYAELLVNQRKSAEIGYRQLSLDYTKGSPLIPANLQFSTFLGASQTNLLQPGQAIGVRAFIGFGNDNTSQSVNYYKGTLGLRGDIGGGWRYDVDVTYAKSDAGYKFDSFITSRLRNSVNAVVAPAGFTGGVVKNGLTCAVNITNPGNGCIVAPPVNSQTVGGQLPDDFKNYVFRPVYGTTEFEETTATAEVNGPLFDIWAGPVKGAFGVEYRYSKIDDTPSAESQANDLLNLTAALPTRGDDSVYEIYGEIEVPLLKDLPFAKDLSINLSGRFTDYKSYGSDETYKVGGIYTPFDWISLRATYGTSYRAPALFEQFLGATSGFLSQQSDPCNSYGAAGVSPIRAANCASEGLPGTFQATTGITVFNVGGAASGLSAETSDNFTAGLVLQHDFGDYGDFAFAVDYYKIEISNGVQNLSGAQILNSCYDDPQFRTGNSLCRFVAPRVGGSNALTVTSGYTNISSQKVEGIDYNIRWTGDIGPGSLRLNGQLTQYLEQSSRTFPTDDFEDDNGTIGLPEFTGTFDATYSWTNWKFRYGFEWTDSVDSFDLVGLTGDPASQPFVFDIGQYWLHNFSVQYADEDNNWSATVGVRNAFDKQPPVISTGAYSLIAGNTPLVGSYDLVGRQFFVNITKGF